MDDAPWSPAAFEARYAADADPWSFASSAYEQGRYAAILAALRPAPHRYRLGFEPACSVGVLTQRLLARCDRLVATDVSPSAVVEASRRCGHRPGLRIDVAAVEDGPGTLDLPDLVVFSELGYYFDRAGLGAVVERLIRTTAPGGDLVACHWTGDSPDHRLHGSEVHEVLTGSLADRGTHVRSEVHDGFVLDSWRMA
ncbi:SAM-dependent methyltransferase [Aquihabitans daechungensis]|uniref:SAM-dependent methyltransferase n=1 Tax=Aquihabitans daechungensis TaxID=1052257 RepID=UPI003B9FF6FF